jgi:pyridoxine 5'-phosphate synthase PdxJ
VIDNEMIAVIRDLQRQIDRLEMRVIANKSAVAALCAAHPNPELVVYALDQASEQAKADGLTLHMPDDLLDVMSAELDGLRLTVLKTVNAEVTGSG